MFRRSATIGGVLGFLLISVLAAQEGYGQSSYGSGGSGSGSSGSGSGGGRGGRMLLSFPEVQKELGITTEQKMQLQSAQQDMYRRMLAAMAPLRPRDLRDMSPEEREKKMAEIRKKTGGETIEDKVAKILTAKQLARLIQIRLQAAGLAALGRPEFAKQLDLSEEQQAKIKKILESNRPAAGAAGGRATNDERRDARARAQKLRKKVDAQILALLTDAQKAKWSEMKGKKFDLAALTTPSASPDYLGHGGGRRVHPFVPPEKNEDQN